MGALALALTIGAASLPLRAADTPKSAAAAPAGLRGDVLLVLGDAEKKLAMLAEAVPADKYDWRPGPGVRSFGEVFLHVAGGNYLLASKWGVKPPAGVDTSKLEANAGDKAQVIATLKASFDHVRSSIQSLTDKDLDRTVDFFGGKRSVRLVLLAVSTHAHEHLGQAIAYARVNGIVPPWSAQEAPPKQPS